MRNWTMVIVPLALAMTAAGCNGAVSSDGNKGGNKSGSEAAGESADAGPPITRNFALTGFTGVEVAGPDDVTIRQGDAFSITAKGPRAEIDELEIKRDGDRLSIGRKREGFSFGGRDHEGVAIAITMPRLNAVRLTGSGAIDADLIDGDTVKAVLTGSGDLKVAKLSGRSADISVSGSGDVEIGGGTIEAGEIGVTGSGDVDADALTATTLKVSITGSGNVDAQATGTAEVRILGSGDAKITGGASCSTRQMGSGTVTCN